MTTDHRIFLAHELGRGTEKSILRPDNPYAGAFIALKEAIGKKMHSRAIRAWHYTRLTDLEVDALRRDGIHASTPATLRPQIEHAAAHRRACQFFDPVAMTIRIKDARTRNKKSAFSVASRRVPRLHHCSCNSCVATREGHDANYTWRTC